ncbi:hypothetical protein Glove_46g48 [Diversispora epigaea]|uniref:DNA-directed DNA polymerase n=1 Tax=Diversispora epigaea TaxID=1348612 RepID=A0A397JNH4_9GLOM|nr:hypothetical protein Glove_46g48 [Diversispora epigaea]
MELVLSMVNKKSLTIADAIKHILKTAEEEDRPSLTKNLYPFINKKEHEFRSEYGSICFDHACLNAKQTALKVYMNTFYGEAGNSESPFFLLELAGGVTSAGQRNIKLIADFVKDKGFRTKYGDTDSLYLVAPKEYFHECDMAYDDGNGISKEEYWSKMVEISMKEMGELRDEVNEFLKKDNGSTYLKMAYEEVLFPVVFTGGESKKVGDCMEYPEVVKKLNKKIDIEYYLKKVVSLCARFINSGEYYEPASDLESLKNVTDPDEIWTTKDNLAQKSAEKWIKNYIKHLRDDPKKEEAIISHLWEDAITHAEKICSGISEAGITRHSDASTGHNDYLNALDKIADSIRLKLSELLSKLSKLNVEYRNSMYKLIVQVQKCKTDMTILEEYIFRYDLESECEALIDFRNIWYKVIGLEIARLKALSSIQSSKKDDPSEADIDDIINLYC